MVYARDAVREQLPNDLFARIGSYEVQDRIEFSTPARRDESAAPRDPPTPSMTVREMPSGAARPLIIPLDDQRPRRHIEILDHKRGDRVVTVVELLTPESKDDEIEREDYRARRRNRLSAGISLVEIDLLRGGRFTVAVPLSAVPQHKRAEYCVCTRRAARPDGAEFYPIPIRAPLPTIRIPLRASDADVTLNVQAIIAECYRNGRYGQSIDYHDDPDPPLTGKDAAWANKLLRQAGRAGS